MALAEVAEDRGFSAERSVARFRVAVVLGVTLLYFGVGFPSRTVPGVVEGLILVGWVYSLTVVLLEPYRRFAPFATSVATSLIDGITITAWVYATGGIASPYYLIYYAAVPTIAFRFGARETLIATGLYTLSYFVLLSAAGELVSNGPEVAVRLSFLVLVGAFSALITRDAARQAKERLEMRQRMREAVTAEKRFRGILEAAPDAMVIYEPTGRIVLVNSEAERIFGYGRQELVDAPLEKLVPQGLPRPPIVPGGAPSVATAEVEARRKAGGAFDAEARVSPVQTEDSWWFTATLRDLTDRKRAEEERITSLERLKELERLRELDQFKTQFINTAAHELGTPLTPIKLQVHLLKSGRDAQLTPGQRKSLDILERNVNRLHELVRDVLDVARLQASRLGINRAPIDLNRVVLESAESFQEPARQADVRLEVVLSPNLQLEGDANRLTQVLFNLLANALKFTPPGGSISLETRQLDNMAGVYVTDTGMGLKSDDLRRLFQPFSQVHDPMQKTRSGSGLGLYISKGIVELHGGRIWCESPGPGLGSTFAFVVPLHVPEAKPAKRVRQQEQEDTVVHRARELI